MFEINVLFSFVTDKREKRIVICNDLTTCFTVINEALKTIEYYNENECCAMYSTDNFIVNILENAYDIEINKDFIDIDYLKELIEESDNIRYKQRLLMQL